ncbi:MAG: NAD synthetase [Flavobacteriales bacterium]|nr:NAD synthetase [Flavobacteriales bacterium]|tara:strand:+ start:97 stop:1215 length:1119 start_codon:yes stop_codon:yes gene_type:complete
MKKLGLLKEGIVDKIVALSPSGVEKLSADFQVFVEDGAGQLAGFTNEMYKDSGAIICKDSKEVIVNSDILLSFSSRIGEYKLNCKKVFIGFFNVLNDKTVVLPYTNIEADVYSLDLIPRSTIAQAMDIISSVASISGYQAVLTAAEMSPMVVPMVTSAGGTLKPAKFLILGAGVAGLQAIATAKRLGASVKAFDVRKNTKNEVESLGAQFIEIKGAVENQNAGGYAVQQSAEYLDLVNKRIAEECINADVVITTAKIPGKQAPTLVLKSTVDKMKPGSVIIDLAAENGGNCELTRRNEIIDHNGVHIVGLASMLNRCAHSVSTLASNNFTSFIKYYLNHIDQEESNEILSSTKVVSNGKIINQQLINEVNAL